MENPAHYIIRASFSQERMQYLDQEGKVIYTAKDKKTSKVFSALEWLAAMCSHIPNRGEQMVRYYGYYSNVSRGKRKEKGTDDVIPCILEPAGQDFLDIQDRVSYTSHRKKKVLINSIRPFDQSSRRVVR